MMHTQNVRTGKTYRISVKSLQQPRGNKHSGRISDHKTKLVDQRKKGEPVKAGAKHNIVVKKGSRIRSPCKAFDGT